MPTTSTLVALTALSLACLASPARAEDAHPLTAVLLEEGRAELAAACSTTPGASVLVIGPGDEGALEVPCSTWHASPAPSTSPDSEHVATARQRLTPIGGILCSIASLVATTAAANECRKWRGANSEACGVGTFTSGAAWIYACYIAL